MRRSLAIGLLLAGLAGCRAVGPDYRPPAPPAGLPPATAFAEGANPAFEAHALPPHWWRLYDDPLLDALVEKALAHNNDLRVAAATLEQAQAALSQAHAERSPTTTLTVDPSYGQSSADAKGAASALSPGPVYDGEFDISYDLDLFGRLRRGIEAAGGDVQAARAALDLARVNVAAETASSYSQACAAGLRIAVQQRSIVTAQSNLDVAARRQRGGISGVNDVIRARTLLRQTMADEPALHAAQRTALLKLATLTGDVPERLPPGVAACASPPILRQPIPIGDGAMLLRRRPDVREAERTLAADVARIGVSTASLYPSVTIGGSLGTTATSLPDITRDRAFHWSVAPLIDWTFPNRSIARAQIASANATAKAQLARFDGTVLTALQETESALVTLARELDTIRDLAAARDDAVLAARNVHRLYAGGVSDFLDVLDAERTAIQAESALASAQQELSADQIQLFMALGGGWEDAPPVESADLQRAETPRTHAAGPRPNRSN